jgi:hypothetical protein
MSAVHFFPRDYSLDKAVQLQLSAWNSVLKRFQEFEQLLPRHGTHEDDLFGLKIPGDLKSCFFGYSPTFNLEANIH